MNIKRMLIKEEVTTLLNKFDEEFNPKISEKVGSIEKYAEKLINKGEVYVAYREEKVVGFFSIYINLAEVYISLIAVEQKYRKQNIGTKLLKEVEKICEEHNLARVRLEVDYSNRNAQKFYIKSGFRMYEEATQTSIYLIKAL